METAGILSLVPTMTVMVLAIATRRPLHALLIGVLLGHIMIAGAGFFKSFADGVLDTMADPLTGWLIVAVGLFGSFIALMVRGGATSAFSKAVVTGMKSRAHAVLMTWLLGIVIFIDDYLNSLTVGPTMKKVNDHFKVSREMLAYVVDSTAAPVCILIPVSSWAIVVAGMLEANGVAAQGLGFQTYMTAIPYMFYAWVVVMMVPLVGMKLIPPIGQMKVAEQQVTGATYSPDEHDVDIGMKRDKEGRLRNFMVPMCVLIGMLWLTSEGVEIDIMQSIIGTVIFTGLFYTIQGVMSWEEVIEAIRDGFTFMVPLITLVAVTFMLRDINDELKLAEYVIQTVQPIMTPQWLPAVTFLTLSLVTFAAASFWGVYAVSLPIVLPLAQSLDVPLPLVIGAVVSAGAFGSHACFYADATILSARASGCDPMNHAFTQIPYAIIAALLAAAGFYISA